MRRKKYLKLAFSFAFFNCNHPQISDLSKNQVTHRIHLCIMAQIMTSVHDYCSAKKARYLHRAKLGRIYVLELLRARIVEQQSVLASIDEITSNIDIISRELLSQLPADSPWLSPANQVQPAYFMTSPSNISTIPATLLPSFPFPYTPDRLVDHGECSSAACPVRELHLAGLYYHKNVFTTGKLTQWFGHSYPPAEVWDAVKRLEAGGAAVKEGDEAVVRGFRRCHYYKLHRHEPRYEVAHRRAKAAYENAIKATEEQKREETAEKKRAKTAEKKEAKTAEKKGGEKAAGKKE